MTRRKTVGIWIGAIMATLPAHAEMKQHPAYEMLTQWYGLWDRLYTTVDGSPEQQEVVNDLANLVASENIQIQLISATLTTREQFRDFLVNAAKSDNQDVHELRGFKLLTENTLESYVHFQRTQPARLELKGSVQITTVVEEGKLRIQSYNPRMEPPQTDSLKQEVLLTLAQYFQAFQTGSVETTLPFYSFPLQVIQDQGSLLVKDISEGEQFLKSTFKTLKEKGYTSSESSQERVEVLSDRQALIHLVITRFRGTEVLEVMGASYVFKKSPEGHWQIVFGSSHRP